MENGKEEKTTSSSILKQYFDEKKKQNPHFSVGLLAKKINLSVSYLSRVLSGARLLPVHHLSKISEILDIDDIKQIEIESLVLKEKGFEKSLQSAKSLSFSEVGTEHMFLLTEWYYLAVLELSTCEGFQLDPEWIGAQLKLSEDIVSKVLDELIASEVLAEIDGSWKKNAEKIRFPDVSKNRKELNAYQVGSIKKVHDELLLNIDSNDMARRLAMGGTVAVNSKKLAEAKKVLNKAILEAMDILSDGPCDSVYQLAFHLAPLTGDLVGKV